MQLLAGSFGAADAAKFASEGRKAAGSTLTSPIKNLGMNEDLVSHCAAFTGLAAGTYSYRIGAVYEGSGEHWTYGTFTVKAGAYETVKIVNMNDAQTKDAAKYYMYANTCAAAVKMAGGVDKIDFLLDGGDFFHMRGEGMTNAGDNGTSGFVNNIRWAMAAETAAPHFMGVPWVHVGGNHDDTSYALTCPEAFAITNSPHGKGVTYVGCHSFIIGNVYVATMPYCLDQTLAIEWLKADLAASQANASVKWRVVALHNGPYTTGDHAVSKNLGYAETEAASNRVVALTPIFAANRVDLVLQAHDHTFVKTVPYRWGGRGYTTSETDAETLNLSPTTEAEGGLVYDVDPRGTYYVSAGCAGHRVGENTAYADRPNAKSFAHRNLKIATGKIKVTSSVSAAGDDASKDTGKQMFAVLESSGDRLTYKFYLSDDYANEMSELYDYVAIRKTAVSDEPVTPYVEPEGEGEDEGEGGDGGQEPEEPEAPAEPEEPAVPAEPQLPPASVDPVIPPELDEDPVIPEGAVRTVSELVSAISNGKAGDTIYIAPGIYDLKGTRMSESDDPGYAHLYVQKKYTFVGLGRRAGDTVLKGAGNTDCGAGFPLKVMYISVAGTVISNLTITGGYDTSSKKNGGGITYASTGGSLVVNCIISNNYTSSSGGGLGGKYSSDSSADSVSAIRCLFVDNGAAGNGGAMTCRGSYTQDCVFSNNWCNTSGGAVMSGSHFGSRFYDNWCYSKTAGQGGGAVGRDNRANAYHFQGPCVDCRFVGNGYTNKAVTAAAVYGAPAVSNCYFAANHCETDNAVLAGVPIVSHCTFEDHVDVPVMMRCTDVAAEIDSCVFRNNSVGSDGFFYFTAAVIRNSLFTKNQMSSRYSRSGDCDFQNCTFADNSGISSFIPAACSAANCVFANNSPYEIPSNNSYIPLMTNCLWTSQQKTNETVQGYLDAKCSGVCKLLPDVKFADPANGNYLPKNGKSPLYNAGYEDKDYLAAVGATDCAGGVRRMFGRLDVGAFELQKRPGLQVLVR